MSMRAKSRPQSSSKMASVAAGGAAHVIAEIADDAGADLIVAGRCWAGSRIVCCTSHTTPCWSLPPKSAGASVS